MASAPLLSVRRLRVLYPKRGLLPWSRNVAIRAIDDLHFDLQPGETLGIVGESGCGKSTLARTLVGLQGASSGSIRYQGRELIGLGRKEWRPLRSEVQLVFQDPLGSLSPKMKIVDIVAEPLKALQPDLTPDQRRARALALLARVGLGDEIADRRAAELSGGQGQRVGIARALIVEPKLLICDEPVSALDVSIQAQIINLLSDLARERQLAMIFIAHDLAVVRQLADRVMVLYLGKVMEQGRADDVYSRARHPYTRALLDAVPVIDEDATRPKRRRLLGGSTPDPGQPPMGCVFHPRCPLVEHACVQSAPGLRKVASGDQYAACHFVAAADS
jgi:oligopeptide transport system ATP-binding protein